MSQLYRVVYCSRNCLSGAAQTYAAEIEAILAKSRVNNARDGITGGLLFNDGCFAQVLEGPVDAVEATFERIQCDDRHGEVTMIEAGPILARDFPAWSMAFNGQAGDANPLAKQALADAFAGRTSAGDDVLRVLRQVVAHDNAWSVMA